MGPATSPLDARWTRPCRLTLLIIATLSTIDLISRANSVGAQRSLHHWKHDLEHRIRIYSGHKQVIDNIILSSILTDPQAVRAQPGAPIRISSNGNVRFSDLIIPAGSLRLSPHAAHRGVDIMVNRTRDYVRAKENQLFDIQSQVDNIKRQLADPNRQYIYKGVPGSIQSQHNSAHKISGTRVFKQVHYGLLFEAGHVELAQVNYTDVNRVIDETYLHNKKVSAFDAQGRLFFEGRKTFWNTVFSKALRSGCCDRLRPLHTSRMMLRSIDQEVLAPVLLWAGPRSPGQPNGPVAVIRKLSTPQLYNRPIEMSPGPPMLPNDIGLRPTLPENFIRLPNLISTRQLGQPEVLKTIVFKNPVLIDEASLANSFIDNRLVIGIASQPQFAFDLAPDNYLLKFSTRNLSAAGVYQPVQHVAGTLVLEAGAHFLAALQAASVNQVEDFARFVHEVIVRTDRPASIRGPIQFNALPTMLDYRSSNIKPALGRPHNVLILRASRGLEVGLVNGMHIPQDLVLLPSSNQHGGPPQAGALKPGELIRVRGPRNFANEIVCHDSLLVSGLVNGLQMPAGVIPLHLNDDIASVGRSNLWFVDGIWVQQMSIASGYFDEINLRDVNGDAQSILLRSMTVAQPDGSLVIRVPLQIGNLNLVHKSGGGSGGGGHLNGFKPPDVLELSARYPYGALYGRKRFLAPVEAAECTFSEINQVANWTQHLIRTDRPNTVQTVHTRLIFANNPAPNPAVNLTAESQVRVDRLNVEFLPDANTAAYQHNWNFAPEFYLLHLALVRTLANNTGGRYRVLNGVTLIHQNGARLNNIQLGDVVRLDQPFNFADTFTMVGKVDIRGSLSANRIQSNYPLDAMDLVQFDKYRIPVLGTTRAPIRLNSLVLGPDNRAAFVQCRLLNGIPATEFLANIMSLTRPQEILTQLTFNAPTNFEAMVGTLSSLNGVKQFRQFANNLRQARYLFEDGLQCNSVVIRV